MPPRNVAAGALVLGWSARLAEGNEWSKSSNAQTVVMGEFEVFCGLDVAREAHHAVVLDHAGRRLADRPLPNAEAELDSSTSSVTRRRSGGRRPAPTQSRLLRPETRRRKGVGPGHRVPEWRIG